MGEFLKKVNGTLKKRWDKKPDVGLQKSLLLQTSILKNRNENYPLFVAHIIIPLKSTEMSRTFFEITNAFLLAKTAPNMDHMAP